MTLEQLRIFVAVAEREHVTQAARDLHLTQSATSAAIAALESRHATKLFDRLGRRIFLTEAGRLFLTEAKAVLARAAAAEGLLADLAGLSRGSLTLAASQTVGNYWLPRLIKRYRDCYPAIDISLMIGNTASVSNLAREGAIDFGVVEGAVHDPSFTVDPVGEDELILVVPPDHPWISRRPLLPAELGSAKWVLRERGSATRSIFEAALPSLGIEPEKLQVSLELPSNEAVRAAVEAGAGVTVISRLVAARSLKAGSLVSAEMDLPRRRFFALRLKERHMTHAARAFYGLFADAQPGPGDAA